MGLMQSIPVVPLNNHQFHQIQPRRRGWSCLPGLDGGVLSNTINCSRRSMPAKLSPHEHSYRT